MVKLVQTRRQGREAEKEDQKETEEKGELKELTKTQKWVLGVKRKFQVSGGRCLVDPNYTCKTRKTLSKEEYRTTLSNNYLIGQLSRFLGWVCMLDLARAKETRGHLRNKTLGKCTSGKKALACYSGLASNTGR